MGMLAGDGALFVNRPEFGRPPQGARLARMEASPHYMNGQFQNLVPVQVMNEKSGENRFVATAKFLFGDKSQLSPKEAMLSDKTDLKTLDVSQDAVVWMGHSTFFLQLGGRRILIDPVFSSYASPVFFINKAFPGSNIYTAADMPEIDVLAISHDHWDHLDYPTVMALKPKIKNIVCPLGVGEYFEQWGFDLSIIHEEDWDTEIRLADDFSVHILPSQHFSGRFLRRNPTLWCGMAFVTPVRKVYYTGDGGYGEHFKAIGQKFGGFDLMLGENGQYNMAWHAIHMLPEETAQAAVDVGARILLPAHGGKFALSRHPWQEPYRELTRFSQGREYKMLTPEIGEVAYLDSGSTQNFGPWWEDMK
ncbi:L-ascorbate metabolism protein UlaG, beta-lactamase superfamily [Selenomonas ruminantium]|uniref:L-ascorbate metabolism protein UlaG, beta-lactamase superfamily n=1 Tax=Selenomonas ruminantium TaxID=971 RepID=A0A1M6X8I0_SELRU|nr:L-ascorbate metabolism protein UlaG, beta-lactamase superfamily [Selenomonas ruminantium]